MKHTTLSPHVFFAALIAVSACAAVSMSVMTNLAARVLLVQDTSAPTESPPPESPGADEKWRQDLLRNLDDQLRNMKDLERNANQSKDTALLSDIQGLRSSIDGHKSCVQNASTQEALQECNDAMQSMWDANSRLWTKSDIANRKKEFVNMERQIKDAEREKIDVSKAKSVLEQYRTALANAESLLQSGVDNRDVQDALQDTVNPLQQEFYTVINGARRQGEAARFRNDQLKNMERQIKDAERNKGDMTKLREILEQVKSALANAEQLVQSGADSRDVDDAFQAVYDTGREFSDLQSTANRAVELRDREKDLKNMERELLRVEKQKEVNAGELRALFEEYKTQLAGVRQLLESAADPQDVNDAFQALYDEEGPHQKFWNMKQGVDQGTELQRWTKKGGEISNMEREIKRLAREKVDTSALQTLLDQIKAKLQDMQGMASPEDQRDAGAEVQELQSEFWNTTNALNMKSNLLQWARKGGHLAKMEKIVKTMEKKGKDVGAAKAVLENIRTTIADLEQSTDGDELEEGRYELDTLRQQFEDAIRPFLKKKAKGFPFPMKGR